MTHFPGFIGKRQKKLSIEILMDLQKEIHCIKNWLGQNRSTTKNIIVDVEAKRELKKITICLITEMK